MADHSPFDQIQAPVDMPSRLPESSNYPANDNAPVDQTPAGQIGHVRNTSGGNEDSGIQWPEQSDPFWSWPQELQVEWALNRQAEQRFDQGLDHYLQETQGPEFPESVKEAVSGLAWSMLAENPKAYAALRAGNSEVAAHFFQEAMKVIQNLAADHANYKPGRATDNVLTGLGPKADSRWTLDRMRRAETPRPVRTTRPEKRTLDQFIADLGDQSLSYDEALGRYGSK